MDPLPMKSFPRFRGADVKSLISSCLIPGGTFMVFFLMLAPMVTTLTEVSQAMCGGNMNFVWTADKRTSPAGSSRDGLERRAKVDEQQRKRDPDGADFWNSHGRPL
ncbi:osm1 [Symbiodinium sp. KB8]|nr:osm1 [Symbiodinium sp. KB8]